jgi:NADH-quinone oxidoreductase subunit E
MLNRTTILIRHKPEKDNLLLILHDIQNNSPHHFISEEDMVEIAEYLNISFSSVYGVVTYYSMFSIRPRGKYIIRVCNSPVCEMSRAGRVLNQLEELLGISSGETTSDGVFTLETSECLGQCAESPAMIINDRSFGKLDPDHLKDLLKQFNTGKNEE